MGNFQQPKSSRLVTKVDDFAFLLYNHHRVKEEHLPALNTLAANKRRR